MGSVGPVGSDESEQEQTGRGRHLAGAAGAAAAAGGAIVGAQGLLGLDVAEAATGEDGTIDSVVPLGDAPEPADDLDRAGDVDAFLDEDATVALSEPGTDPLGNDLADGAVDDPVGDAFAATDDPTDALGGHDRPGDPDLDALDDPGAAEEPDAGADILDL